MSQFPCSLVAGLLWEPRREVILYVVGPLLFLEVDLDGLDAGFV